MIKLKAKSGYINVNKDNITYVSIESTPTFNSKEAYEKIININFVGGGDIKFPTSKENIDTLIRENISF